MSYISSFFSAAAGIVTLNDIAILVGILMALLTGIGNYVRETRRERDRQRLTELDEQIKALQLKKLLQRKRAMADESAGKAATAKAGPTT